MPALHGAAAGCAEGVPQSCWSAHSQAWAAAGVDTWARQCPGADLRPTSYDDQCLGSGVSDDPSHRDILERFGKECCFSHVNRLKLNMDEEAEISLMTVGGKVGWLSFTAYPFCRRVAP